MLVAFREGQGRKGPQAALVTVNLHHVVGPYIAQLSCISDIHGDLVDCVYLDSAIDRDAAAHQLRASNKVVSCKRTDFHSLSKGVKDVRNHVEAQGRRRPSAIDMPSRIVDGIDVSLERSWEIHLRTCWRLAMLCGRWGRIWGGGRRWRSGTRRHGFVECFHTNYESYTGGN